MKRHALRMLLLDVIWTLFTFDFNKKEYILLLGLVSNTHTPLFSLPVGELTFELLIFWVLPL